MKASIPKPFSIAIDDLGWMQGTCEDMDLYGPARIGLKRTMDLSDYEAVVDLGEKVGVRLQALFILGEMDRENFLGQYPNTTQMRENWDNSEHISDLQIEIMEYVKKAGAHLEFGLHGVGHEFWPEEGKRRRAEWYNTEDDHPWPEEDIRNHMDCFVKIMSQYGLSKENGHSFPQSFVPCAYSYYWNPEGDYSLGSVLIDYGVKYANTDFQIIPECNPPTGDDSGGFDHGVHVLNRYNYGNLWYELSKLPTTPLSEQPTSYIETHWPNLLAQDNFLQTDITEQWASYYKKVQQSPDRYAAKNTVQHHAQWLYYKHTVISEDSEGSVTIDNSNMPSEALGHTSKGNLVIQIPLKENEQVSLAYLDDQPVPAYFKYEGYGYLYLPPLSKKTYQLKYEIGHSKPQNVIWHDGTSNIFKIDLVENTIQLHIELYGSQIIRLLKGEDPQNVSCDNEGIKIRSWQTEGEFLKMDLNAHDIQGESGIIKITY